MASFGPTTSWVGKTITYESGQFVLEGDGPITPDAVLEYERQGHLVWAYEGLGEWVQAVASRPVVPVACRPTGRRATPTSGPRRWRVGPRKQPDRESEGGSWPSSAILLVVFGLTAVVATVLKGGYVRDGVGIALTVMSGAFAVLGILSVTRPPAFGRGATRLVLLWSPVRADSGDPCLPGRDVPRPRRRALVDAALPGHRPRRQARGPR